MQDKMTRTLCDLVRKATSGSIRIPSHAAPLWDTFTSLSRTRRYSEIGPDPISYQEVAAYRDLMGVPLASRHVAAIMAMDAAWLESAAEKLARAPTTSMQKASHIPVTPEIFDAMMG